MRVRILKEEVEFWNRIATWCNKKLPQKRVTEFTILFKEDGGLRGFVEDKLRDLIEDIKEEKVSLKGFTFQDAALLTDLLDLGGINQNLQKELSSLLYGADERARYFNK